MNDPALFGPSMLGRRLDAGLRDIQSNKSSVRRAAARDLAPHINSSERNRVVTQLSRVMLEDSDTEVRVAAILALVEGGAIEAIESILVAARSGPPRIQQMALLALGEIAGPGMPEAIKIAFEAIESELPALRYQGLVTLRCLGQLQATEPILLRTTDSDPEVRWVTVRLLEELWASVTEWSVDDAKRLRFEQQAREALRPLLEDVDRRVRVAATLVLARVGDTSAGECLPNLLAQSGTKLDLEDEELAIELAGQLRIQSARAALERRAWPWLWESSRSWKARVALAQLGDERACNAVLQNLDSRSPAKRARAIEAAGRIGLQRARPRLLAMLESPSVGELEAIRTALSRLGPIS